MRLPLYFHHSLAEESTISVPNIETISLKMLMSILSKATKTELSKVKDL